MLLRNSNKYIIYMYILSLKTLVVGHTDGICHLMIFETLQCNLQPSLHDIVWIIDKLEFSMRVLVVVFALQFPWFSSLLKKQHFKIPIWFYLEDLHEITCGWCGFLFIYVLGAELALLLAWTAQSQGWSSRFKKKTWFCRWSASMAD